MDPAQWLSQYEERLRRTAANAAAAGERLRDAGGRASSPGGEVTVTVGAGGALDDVTLTPAVGEMAADRLARLIVTTVRQARLAAAARVAGIMTDYLGKGPALEIVTSHLPAEREP
ncbi:YbaB/EbfC family nucleoid-associated protein [Actinophytocola algeriensis]|uniref:DNA-binding protein YbaB n=1 Tax=Actinophytocola algeriensis TaxID=1768010 RepID=A0A7W7Q996_9PSEU|nr:YbaB/EbfC family nucleoid-associated protein [Actinophytocola algeriensis]MBB4909410.1 DNA-binding protein YbaB [Actinophytocola algeriensis]MBE1475400.1 DNA-binding protein YbaB [Actinophytocola algeriensis]